MNMKLHVAVVDREGGSLPSHRSDRPKGDWACFVGENREVVIKRALAARNDWGPNLYRVLVGELTGEVREPVRYEVVPLPEEMPF